MTYNYHMPTTAERPAYGVICEICHEGVEYADITSHPCSARVREQARHRANRKPARRFDAFWHHKDRKDN